MSLTPKKLHNLGVSPTSMFKLLKDQPSRIFRLLYLDEPRSPAPHLLTSNALPTDEEISLIIDALSCARVQHAKLIRKLGSQPTTSRTGSSRVEQQIQAVNHFIAAHEARILPSPILQLPVELLQIIFRMVTDALVNDRQSNRYSYYTWTSRNVDLAHLPWTISHVCQQWRNVVLSTPDLWSVLPKVELDPSRWSTWRRRRTLQIASKILDRSVGSTITASINGRAGLTPPHPAIKLLVAHCGRWSKLDVIVDDKGKVLDELEPLAGRLSSLHTLILEFRLYWAYPSNAHRTIDLFRDVPFLKHVTLKEPPFYFSFPKGQIQTLTLHLVRTNTSMTKGHLGVVRSSSVSLTALTLKAFVTATGGYLCETSLNLPNLISLTFNTCSGEGKSGWLVDHILVPSLQKLDLTSCAADEDLYDMVYDMLSRSGCSTIYDLCILQHGRQPKRGSVIKLLEIEPFLRRLYVTIPQGYDLIALANGLNPPAPFLEHCIFSISEFTPLDLNTLITPLKSIARNRCPPNPRFKPSPILRRVGQHPRDGEVPLFLIKTYQFIFNSEERATQVQFLLEGFPSYDSCFPASNLLNQAKHVLGGCLYEVGLRFTPWPTVVDTKSRPEKEDFEKMDKILNEVLSTEINHVAEIVVTDLHRVLAYITKRYKDHYFPEYGPLVRLATSILQSWVPVFEKYTPSWHCTSDARWSSPSLVYVGKNGQSRKSHKDEEEFGKEWCDSAIGPFL